MNSKAFYLKINRNEGYTIRNLKHWLDIISTYSDVDFYIVCDNQEVKHKVIDKAREFLPDIENKFIESIITDKTKYIIDNVTNDRWHMAGYAHISTFVHSKENGYDTFWNIDADDTRFCLSPQRSHELLDEAEKYAIANGIDCFSLDMHTTLIGQAARKQKNACSGGGRHWSFGITYTTNKVDWMEIMNRECLNDIDTEDIWPNIDRFFRYIRNHVNDVCIESFYFENLKFLHYSNDFFWRLNESALFHWKDGHLTLPILYYGVGLQNEKSHMKIDPIVKKLDIGITDEETMVSMINACNNPCFYLKQ